MHPFLFGTKNGTPYQQQNLNRTLTAIAKGTTLAWVRSHAFRKTSGTVVYRENGITAASNHLAHSDEKITADIYVERDRDSGDNRAALQSLAPARLGQPLEVPEAYEE